MLVDLDSTCTHTMFGRYGAEATVAGDAVWMAVAGFDESWLFRMDATAVERVADAPMLPEQHVQVATDLDGALVLLGTAADRSSTLVAARLQDDWELASIDIASGVKEVADLAAAGDGSMHGWFFDGDYWNAARGVAGTWTIDEAHVPVGAPPTRRFTIASDGRDVAATHAPTLEADGYHLLVNVGDDPTLELGADVADLPATCTPVPTSFAGLPASAPAFVVLSSRTDAIVLDSPTSPDESFAIPDTVQLVPMCPVPLDNECLPDCRDTAAGVLAPSVVGARTADGTVWVAWVYASLDRVTTTYEQCDNVKGGCTCQHRVLSDASSFALRLVAVRPDGTIEPALDLPLAAHPCGNDRLEDCDGVDVHAVDDELAIAVRVAGSDVLPDARTTVRTIRFDASFAAADPGLTDPPEGPTD